MGNIVADRIASLREIMKSNGINWYFATSDDFHASEYVADYFKIREFFTGFTGENAFLILNLEKAYMWTDGRFFIQAARELEGSGVELMKMMEPGVPTIYEFFEENLKQGDTLLFDGRMVSTSCGLRIESIAKENKANIIFDVDYASSVWEERPDKPSSKLFVLSDEVSGESINDKLSRIRIKMKENKAKHHFLGSIDDISWITNVRGNDIECNPVFLAFLLVNEDDAVIFLQSSEASEEIRKYFSLANIKIEEYDEIINYLSSFNAEGKILLDEGSVNYSCYKILESKAELVNKANPSKLMKSIKNETEIARLKEAYLLDSVCVTKFIYWAKHTVGKEEMTELSAADYIDNLRAKVPGFIELSFGTISGYGPNAAMMHYSATPESFSVIKPEGLLLVDSGGQYDKGTTDVTRTLSMGPVTDKMRLHYTKTAVGMLSLANAKFLYGCTGRNLDILARKPLWDLGIDYKCGTGHGVGYILNVHEGPQNIRWKFAEGVKEVPLEPGMITSDEPGVYLEGEYGIRIENIILCVKDECNSDGQFLKFDQLTFAPLDRDLLDKSYLSVEEKKMIDDYQESVYQASKDYLSADELEWLRKETLPL